MATDIGPKIGIEGESEFRRQISQISEGVNTLGSEMKLVTAEFADNANSADALTKKNDVLERTILGLNEKLELQEKMLAASAAEYGEADSRTQKWQRTVNATKTEIANAEAQIRKNNDALEENAEETKKASDETLKFGDVLKANILADAVKAGFKALADGAKKLAGALKDAVTEGAAFADEILTMSVQTGLATDTLQEYQYAANLIDVDLDTITGSLSKLTKNMSTARGGTGDAAKAFNSLGVSVTDTDGSLRDNQTVFNEVIAALGQMENETERDAAAMAIFGKSAQDLNPLIVAGSDRLAELAQEAHDVGFVMSGDTLNALGGVQDSLDRFDLLTQNVKNQLATALAPTIEEVAGKFQEWVASVDWDAVGEKIQAAVDYVKSFFEFIQENGDKIIAVIAGIAAGFVAWEVVSLVTGVVKAIKAFKAANEGATIAQAALNAVMNANPIGIIITVVAGLVAAIITLWNTNEDFRNAVKKIWEDIKGFFSDAAKWFKDVGKNIVEGIWNGIKGAWSWLTSGVKGLFNNLVSGVKSLLGIASPSKVFAQIGDFMAEGMGQGFTAGMKDVERDMMSAIPSNSADVGTIMAGAVNGMQTAVAGMGGGAMTVNLVMPDGTAFARYYLPSFIETARANGTPIANPS